MITVMSALTKLRPASTTRRYARLSRSSESASRQRGSVGGNICPMSPRPAAPRMASVRACATASASECPPRRREPRSGDAHPEALRPGALHEVRGLVGLPVGGGHVELVRNARLAQDVEGGLDTRLVAFGADDNQHVGHSQAASSITL